MPHITIVTDRGCDLALALQDQYEIRMVPLVVRFGAEVWLDDGRLPPDAFWRRVEETGIWPQTSQPSVGMFEEIFAPLVDAGHQVLCLGITSKLSGTCSAAYAAAQRFAGRVTVFDTLSLSLGQGLQVLAAARAAADGLHLDEIVALLEGIRTRTQVFIALHTIEYLRHGGRAGRLMPLLDRVARVLSIRPLLRLTDGELKVMGAARTDGKARQRLLDEVARCGPLEMLAVGHTRRGGEAAAFRYDLASSTGVSQDQVLVQEAGPALSAHAGPGVMAAALVQRSL